MGTKSKHLKRVLETRNVDRLLRVDRIRRDPNQPLAHKMEYNIPIRATGTITIEIDEHTFETWALEKVLHSKGGRAVYGPFIVSFSGSRERFEVERVPTVQGSTTDAPKSV